MLVLLSNGHAGSPPTLKEFGSWLLGNPVLSDRPDCRSFVLEYEFAGVAFEYRYFQGEAPYFLGVDRNDLTPLVAGADGMAMIYDVLQGKVMVLRDQYPGAMAVAHYSPEQGRSSFSVSGRLHPKLTDIQAGLKITSDLNFEQIPELSYEINSKDNDKYIARCSLKRSGKTFDMEVIFEGKTSPYKMESLKISSSSGQESSPEPGPVLRIRKINGSSTLGRGLFPEEKLRAMGFSAKNSEFGSNLPPDFFVKNAMIRSLVRSPSSESDRALKKIIDENRLCLEKAGQKIRASYENPAFLQAVYSNMPDPMMERLFEAKGPKGMSKEEFVAGLKGERLKNLLESPDDRIRLAKNYVEVTSLMAKESGLPEANELPTSWEDALSLIGDKLAILTPEELRETDKKISEQLREVLREFSVQATRP